MCVHVHVGRELINTMVRTGVFTWKSSALGTDAKSQFHQNAMTLGKVFDPM